MNQKITFPELVNAVADATQMSKKISEEFLKEFFILIADTLTSGENVKIRKLGTFKVVDVEQRKSVNVNTGEEIIIPKHRKIAFTPDKDLADAVNLPFSVFEAVEISDDVTDDMLNAVQDNVIDQDNTNNINEGIDESELSTPPNSLDSLPELPQIEWDDSSETETDVSDIQSSMNVTESYNEVFEGSGSQEQANEENGRKSKRIFIRGFLMGIASLLLLLILISSIVYFVIPNDSAKLIDNIGRCVVENVSGFEEQKSESEEINLKFDTISIQSTQIGQTVNTIPSDQIIYDTISRTRFLTTMAKEHYGNFNLWPYIYEENKEILGHPDRIKPGTKVVIPPMSKYGINPESEDCIEKAKQKGLEIYSRYKKVMDSDKK